MLVLRALSGWGRRLSCKVVSTAPGTSQRWVFGRTHPPFHSCLSPPRIDNKSSTIEVNVGIICSCLMLMPAFLERHFPDSVKSSAAGLWSRTIQRLSVRRLRNTSKAQIKINDQAKHWINYTQKLESKSQQHVVTCEVPVDVYQRPEPGDAVPTYWAQQQIPMQDAPLEVHQVPVDGDVASTYRIQQHVVYADALTTTYQGLETGAAVATYWAYDAEAQQWVRVCKMSPHFQEQSVY